MKRTSPCVHWRYFLTHHVRFITVPRYPMISEQAIKYSSRVYLKPYTSILIVNKERLVCPWSWLVVRVWSALITNLTNYKVWKVWKEAFYEKEICLPCGPWHGRGTNRRYPERCGHGGRVVACCRWPVRVRIHAHPVYTHAKLTCITVQRPTSTRTRSCNIPVRVIHNTSIVNAVDGYSCTTWADRLTRVFHWHLETRFVLRPHTRECMVGVTYARVARYQGQGTKRREPYEVCRIILFRDCTPDMSEKW